VDEMREQGAAPGYRQVQELVRELRYREAADLIEALLADPDVGRSRRTQLHNLACWLYDGPLSQPGPRAVLHGEEAVRLSGLLHNPWLRAEAQANLLLALTHTGELGAARLLLADLSADLRRNPALLEGGERALLPLQVVIAAAEGDVSGCQTLLLRIEPRLEAPEVELIRAWIAVETGDLGMAKRILQGIPDGEEPAVQVERDLLLERAAGRMVTGEGLARLLNLGRPDLLIRHRT
jgi:hypothetical protein